MNLAEFNDYDSGKLEITEDEGKLRFIIGNNFNDRVTTLTIAQVQELKDALENWIVMQAEKTMPELG